MYYVYVIYNREHSKIYVGQTGELGRRLKEHNNREDKIHKCTSKFDRDWKLIYKKTVLTRTDAIKREKQLKSYCGREFIKNTFIPL